MQATGVSMQRKRADERKRGAKKRGQDKGKRHHCRVKPMSAHGFLRHVENRRRAGEVCKLLLIAEISRLIYVGVRLNKSRLAGSHDPRLGAE